MTNEPDFKMPLGYWSQDNLVRQVEALEQALEDVMALGSIREGCWVVNAIVMRPELVAARQLLGRGRPSAYSQKEVAR